MFKATARIVFDPLPLSGGPQMFKPFWVIAVVDGYNGKDLGDYYRYLLEKRFGMHVQTSYTPQGETVERKHFGLKLNLAAWGTHISIIRGERVDLDIWSEKKEKFHNKTFEFEYSNLIETNGSHFWLPVKTLRGKTIRKEMGLRENPKWPFHMTIGNLNPKYNNISKHIYNYALMDGWASPNNFVNHE